MPDSKLRPYEIRTAISDRVQRGYGIDHMKKTFWIFTCLLLLLAFRKATPEEDFAEKTLLTQTDRQGRLVRKVVAGNVPGEDKYLHITRYDTSGKATEKYGIDPYDDQFKEVYLAPGNQPPETRRYGFNDYKGAPPDRLFQLADTLADFRLVRKRIGSIRIHRQEGRTGVPTAQWYHWDEEQAKMLDAEGHEYPWARDPYVLPE